MRRSNGILLIGLLAAGLISAPLVAADDLDNAIRATEFTPDEFIAAFDNAELSGLAPVGPPPTITGDSALDARIRTLAENLGYTRRALPNEVLVTVDGQKLQRDAASAWKALHAAATAAGHSFQLISGYRDEARQSRNFRSRLAGTSDSAINAVLRTIAAPGYSKHHTGYAIDVSRSNVIDFEFDHSAIYEWLATENFANAKRFGWIPSYPKGASPAGPVPEPWEFVWIGTENILCAAFVPGGAIPFCDTVGSIFAADITWLVNAEITMGCRPGRFCEDRPITRAEAATMLWRMAGEPAADPRVHAAFADLEAGVYYEDAVAWLVAEGITNGTTPSTFSPDRLLTRAEFVTFLWRFLGSPVGSDQAPGFVDMHETSFAFHAVAWAVEVGVTNGATPTTFAPGANTSRGQAAAFFHRVSLLEPQH